MGMFGRGYEYVTIGFLEGQVNVLEQQRAELLKINQKLIEQIRTKNAVIEILENRRREEWSLEDKVKTSFELVAEMITTLSHLVELMARPMVEVKRDKG
jgi:hypothetical protein